MIITKKIQEAINKQLKKNELYAKKAGRDCDLDLEYLESLVCEYCPVLGIRLDWDFKTYTSEEYPMLINLDLNRKGTRGNMAWVSYKARMMKLKFASYKELDKTIYYLKNPAPMQDLENLLSLWSKSRVLEEEKLQTC